MNLFKRENTQVNDTHLRYEDRFLRPQSTVSVTTLDDGPTSVGFATQSEHELRLDLHVRFRANKAQYRDALANAETVMLHFIYKEALAELSYIRKYAMDGCRELIFESCERLEQALGLK